MSKTVRYDEREPKSGRPRIIVSKKHPNIRAALRNQREPEFFVDETYYPDRYQPLHDY